MPDRRFTVALDDARPATTTFVGSDGLCVSILTEALNKVTAESRRLGHLDGEDRDNETGASDDRPFGAGNLR